MTNISAPFTFSQSSLQDYFDCPRRFQLRYMDQLQWPAVESEPTLENERHQAEGQFFHRLAQQFLLGLPADRLARLAASPDLTRWWENFQGSFPNPAELGTLHAETVLAAPLRGHRLLAKYDLIAVRDGRAVIYDWKTYHKRPKNEWMAARLQTRVYHYLLAVAGSSLNEGQAIPPQNIGMVYWYADFPSEPAVFPYDEAQFQRDRAGLDKFVAEIEGRTQFELTDEEGKCRYCSYRSYCNRGVHAGDWREAEVETEADEHFDLNFEQIAEIAF